MYKLCKTEQSASRQRQLEEGLLAAMKQHRYEEISISDLCDQMQIPRKSFYRYFSSKDGALQALLDHTLLEFQQMTGLFGDTSADADPQQGLVRYFEFWLERRQLLDALEKSGLSGMLVQRAITQALSEYAVPFYPVPAQLRDIRKQAVSFIICGLMSMVLTWHHDGFQQTAREMATVAAAILSSPMIRPAADK